MCSVEPESSGSSRGDRAGCSHQFVQAADQVQVGQSRGRGSRPPATTKPGGWSVRGKQFPAPLDLTGCQAIRAWVYGDGQGEQLKIQLYRRRGRLSRQLPDDRLPGLAAGDAGRLSDQHVALRRQSTHSASTTTACRRAKRSPAASTRSRRFWSVTAAGDDLCWRISNRRFRRCGGAGHDAERVDVRPARPRPRRGSAWWSARATELLETVLRFEQAAGMPSPRAGRRVEQELALDQTLVLLPHGISRVAVRRGAGHRQTRRVPHDPDRPGVVVPQHGPLRGQPRQLPRRPGQAWSARCSDSRTPGSASACTSWPRRFIHPTRI